MARAWWQLQTSTMPREAAYLSFGWANHVATHFWNAQGSYFSDSNDASPVDHAVSFSVGAGWNDMPLYTPRALLFDLRGEFGSLRQRSALFGGYDDDATRQAWTGEVIAEPEVEPSWYADVLDHEFDDPKEHLAAPRGRAIRYWSDYLRVPFHPRSLVRVAAPGLDGTSFLQPMGAASGTQFSAYEQGQEVARAMESDASVMDDSVRWLAEDSDLLQGFHVSTSAFDGFSGYSSWYLAALADEFPKTPRMSFAIAPASKWQDVSLQRVSLMNCALTLAHASETSLLVPLCPTSDVGPHASVDTSDTRAAAAVLAAHMDTATLSTRLLDGHDTYGGIIDQLNWRRDTPIATLGGCMPTPLLAPVVIESPVDALLEQFMSARSARSVSKAPPKPVDIGPAWREFSSGYGDMFGAADDASHTHYASHAVARDGSALAREPTLAALDARSGNDPPHSTRKFAQLAFNVESSFPQIFHGLTRDGRAMNKYGSEVKSLPMCSSLSTSSVIRATLEGARRLVADVLASHAPMSLYGVHDGIVGGRDGLAEVRERLEYLCDAYGGVPDDAEPGTDEEWESDGYDI